jgi:hypothetical protein
MIASGREGWILTAFVTLAVAGLAVCLAGALLLFRERRDRSRKRPPEPLPGD